MENTNSMKLDQLKQEYITHMGREPDAATMNMIVLITNYVDTRISEGATPSEAWKEVARCMEGIASRRSATC